MSALGLAGPRKEVRLLARNITSFFAVIGDLKVEVPPNDDLCKIIRKKAANQRHGKNGWDPISIHPIGHFPHQRSEQWPIILAYIVTTRGRYTAYGSGIIRRSFLCGAPLEFQAVNIYRPATNINLDNLQPHPVLILGNVSSEWSRRASNLRWM